VMSAAAVALASFKFADVAGVALMSAQGITGGSPISGVPVAVIAGLVLNNALGPAMPPTIKPGLQLCLTTVLRAGIVCVGAKLSFGDVALLGVSGLPVVVATISTGLIFVPWLARQLDLPARLGLLTAAGTSICGVTAIVSLAPAIGATQRETAVAVANVVCFGLAGMLTYPYVAHALLPNSTAAGLFLGCSIHDTSQVVGAALTYSQLFNDPAVVKIAAVTKLTRNLFLAGVIPALVWTHARSGSLADAATVGAAPAAVARPNLKWSAIFPTFVLGFVGMAAARSLGDAAFLPGGGLVDPMQWRSFAAFVGDDFSRVCLGTAMAALGLNTSFSVFKGVGPRPFMLGFAGAAVVASVGFAGAFAVSTLSVRDDDGP
jgi:uncharacterized integral membrane protein (TIGR00698 family)